ncbi:MAG: primosomal protein N' [Rickettsiaceae bacterium H1]|nr:primosomal protein N' [Rickettsiaceae bacterium H1]
MYVEVILALPIDKTFYYYASRDISLFSYVKVSFRGKIVIGLVVKIRSDCLIEELKEIVEVIDVPTLSDKFVFFLKWVAKYNIIPLGGLIKISLGGINENENYYSLDLIKNQKFVRSYEKVISLFRDNEIISDTEICEETNVSRETLKKMLQSNIIKLSQRSLLQNAQVESKIVLSEEQKQACRTIDHHLARKVILLEGVTGSGKTEVYLNVIAEILKENSNNQALVILPEIILAAQVKARFEKYFDSVRIVKWHSSLSKKSRRINWWRIVTGKAQIIIGARSSLFLPYKNLKIIVVDEEHDNSFKQNMSKINYHGRDMAIVKAKMENIPIILSSATPSLESFFNARSGKFKRVTLSERHSKVELPSVRVVDMRQNKRDKWVSPQLYRVMKATLDRKKQVLLFLNRRGYSQFSMCDRCGYKLQCVKCSSWLIKHKVYKAFLCHYCGYRSKLSNDCPECKTESSLSSYGMGVEKIEEEVKSVIPDAKVVTISSDLITDKEFLRKILMGEVDIIIGTQMITKGHHFPKISLVGVIDADATLHGGDLRSAERTYQLLQQVSGRAGRENEKGLVLLQTYTPNEIIKRYLCSKEEFYSYELDLREQGKMPPFTKIVTITVKSANEDKAVSVANSMAKELKHNRLRILGPVPAGIYLVNKRCVYKIVIVSPKNFDIQSRIRNCGLITRYNKIIRVDVDSFNLF